MGLFPKFQDEVSDDSIKDVNHILEVVLYKQYKDSVDEVGLTEVSKENLAEAIEVAEESQDENAEFVKEKTQKFGQVAGVFSVTLGEDHFPVNLSLPGIIGAASYGYSKIFSKEVNARKWIIDKGTYREITGDAWVDNLRYQWNIRFYDTMFMFRVAFLWGFYEISPRWFLIMVEQMLAWGSENSKQKTIEEMLDKIQGKKKLDRIQQAEDDFPLSDYKLETEFL